MGSEIGLRLWLHTGVDCVELTAADDADYNCLLLENLGETTGDLIALAASEVLGIPERHVAFRPPCYVEGVGGVRYKLTVSARTKPGL